MAPRPIIKCRVCKEERQHASGGMCSYCYKNSKKRRMEGAYSIGKVERSANGRPLCRWCLNEVPRKRRTFCSEECVHEWSLRTSPQYVRAKVEERDHGICALCGLDVPKMERELSELMFTDRHVYEVKWQWMLNNGWRAARRHGLWEADHICAVVEGGGMHGLDNYRTLCLPCHKKETALLRKRMAVSKRRGIPLEEIDKMPCVCECKDSETCLNCICHYRHDGPTSISDEKHPPEYWEGKGVKTPVITLGQTEFQRVLDLVQSPPKPTERLVKAAQDYLHNDTEDEVKGAQDALDLIKHLL